MKKTMIILLAALLLVCAVSCSNGGKTGINIDTTILSSASEFEGAQDDFFLAYTPAGEELEKKVVLSKSDIATGSVFVELPEGEYKKTYIESTDSMQGGHDQFPVFPKGEEISTGTDSATEVGFFTIVHGEITECNTIVYARLK